MKKEICKNCEHCSPSVRNHKYPKWKMAIRNGFPVSPASSENQ